MGVKSDAGIVSRIFRIKQLDAILHEAEEPEHQLKRGQHDIVGNACVCDEGSVICWSSLCATG